MRTSMKKVAVLAAVFTMALLAASSLALAGHRTIHGEYAIVGSGQCAMSFTGIDPDKLLANGGGSLNPSPLTFYNGTYKFSPNGRGSASLTGKGFNSAGPTDPVGGWVQRLEFDFDYTVEDGAIIFETIPGTDTSTTIAGQGPPTLHVSSGPQKGNISPDGKTLLIHCGAPVIINIEGTPVEAICNISLHGFKKGPYMRAR